MNYKLLIIGVVTVAALILGGLWIADMNSSVDQPDKRGETPAGALSGPDIPSDYLTVGGVRRNYYHQDMGRATTTICAARAPAATSTLEGVFAVFGSTATSAATTVTLGLGTNSNSTSTAFTTVALDPNDSTHFSFASSTVIGPNNWVTLALKGGTGPHSPTGTCNFIFQSAI